jgi:hypothetical protein
MEGFVTLQVTLKPMLLKKPACRLVQTGDTFESVLTQLLADAQRNGDACEARIVDFLAGDVSVSMSSSADSKAGGGSQMHYPAGTATCFHCDRLEFVSAAMPTRSDAAPTAPVMDDVGDGMLFTSLCAQKGLYFPEFPTGARCGESDQVLLSDLLGDLKQRKAGWKYEDTARTKGKEFVTELAHLLWMLTDQWDKLSAQNAALPAGLAMYSGRYDGKSLQHKLVRASPSNILSS